MPQCLDTAWQSSVLYRGLVQPPVALRAGCGRGRCRRRDQGADKISLEAGLESGGFVGRARIAWQCRWDVMRLLGARLGLMQDDAVEQTPLPDPGLLLERTHRVGVASLPRVRIPAGVKSMSLGYFSLSSLGLNRRTTCMRVSQL